MPHPLHQACIDACQECIAACEACATACLQEAGIQKLTHCIQLDLSCADICGLAVREMSRRSEFVEQVCRVCLEACETCANECARHATASCQACARACRKCAETCGRHAAAC